MPKAAVSQHRCAIDEIADGMREILQVSFD
jgi:hypothetical protein